MRSLGWLACLLPLLWTAQSCGDRKATSSDPAAPHTEPEKAAENLAPVEEIPTAPAKAKEAAEQMSGAPSRTDIPTRTDIPKERLQEVGTGLSFFALELFRGIPKDGNTMVSPFSVASALSLLELGARGDAATSLHKSLRVKAVDEYRQGLSQLVLRLVGGGEPVEKHGQAIVPHQLRVANSLWVAENYSIEAEYSKAAREYYGAEPRSLDVSKPDQAAAAVNQWVEEATEQKIKKLISAGNINDLTRMILVNAIHFRGRWRYPFFERATADLPFHVEGKRKAVPVPTMSVGEHFASMQDKEVSAVELPYWSADEEAQLAMLIVVPKKRDGLAQIEESLSFAKYSDWTKALNTQTRVNVKLPKWKAESELELAGTLSGMGLAPIFGNADYTGISSEEGFSLSAVIHKTFISVDEKGTEAAAATALLLAGGMPQKPMELHVDRPFLYFIRDTHSGTILFAGRVVDPR